MRTPLLAALLTLALPLLAAANPARPNILWVVSEDNNPWLGCYGEPLARTPHLDRLATHGVRFTRAHSAAPVCAPSRSSLITGRFAPSLGTQHMRSDVPLPADLRYFPAYLRDAGYFCTNRAKTDYNAGIPAGTWDENGASAHWRHRAPGQPFFAVFNFNASHESNLHTRRPLRTDPARVRVPAYLPDTPTVRAYIAQYHDCLATMDTQVGALLDELAADGLADNTIIFYFGDNGGVLPRSKRFLYHAGTHVPVIISFPARWAHLAPAALGSASDELVNLLDLPPTVLSLVGLTPPAAWHGRALAGPARAPAPRFTYAFRDRMDEAYDLSRAVIGPRYRYVRHYRPELPAGQYLEYLWRMASMSEWAALAQAGRLPAEQAAFFQPRAAEELYDVTADPECMRNLAAEPQHRSTLEEMRAANRAHLLATRDLGFLPEPMLRALAGDASPVRLGQDASVYPLADILDLLDSLQLTASPSPDAARAAATSPHAVLRYWAATHASRWHARPTELEALFQDSEPSVRLAAAFSQLQTDREARAAWAVVAASLRATRPPEERLTAANFVTLLGRFPEEIRARLEQEPDPAPALFANYYRRQVNQALGREPAPTRARAEP